MVCFAVMNSNHTPAKRALLIVIIACSLLVVANAARPVPAELSDQQFWDLSKESSEEDGYFRSDNLLSNETTFENILPDLLKTAKQGRVYLGVGPEQNFTYIAALKPTMAFIIDIRHGNLDVHLLYKALFELSKDRAEFVSRLFSRKRPDGLTTSSTASELFRSYLSAEGSKEMFEENLKAVANTKDQFLLVPEPEEAVTQEVGKLIGQDFSSCHVIPISESTWDHQDLKSV